MSSSCPPLHQHPQPFPGMPQWALQGLSIKGGKKHRSWHPVGKKKKWTKILEEWKNTRSIKACSLLPRIQGYRPLLGVQACFLLSDRADCQNPFSISSHPQNSQDTQIVSLCCVLTVMRTGPRQCWRQQRSTSKRAALSVPKLKSLPEGTVFHSIKLNIDVAAEQKVPPSFLQLPDPMGFHCFSHQI